MKEKYNSHLETRTDTFRKLPGDKNYVNYVYRAVWILRNLHNYGDLWSYDGFLPEFHVREHAFPAIAISFQ